MLAWFAMGIPVLTAVVLLVWFRHKTVWWEFLIPVVASFVLILIGKFTTETFQTRDTEYWGGWVTKAEYYERWDEEVPCRHEIPCSHPIPCSHTDQEGRTLHSNDGYQHSNDGYEHRYDVDNHPPRWVVHDSNGEDYGVGSGKFEWLAKRFGLRQFVDLHRDYHSIDGDKYVTQWPGNDATLVPTTTDHSYENRVAASDSIMNYPKVENPKELGLYDYPKISDYYYLPSILGNGGPSTMQARALLDLWNAKLGARKQVRMWILVFQGGSISTGQDQEAYWKNGNKNEFVITIGVDPQHNIQWTHIFSWTKSERLKIETRDFVMRDRGKPLDLVKIVNWMVPAVQEQWVRREFKEFDHLSIEPPGWVIFLIFFLTFLLNIGLSIWIIMNQYEEGFSGAMHHLWNDRRRFARIAWPLPFDPPH